MSRRRLAALLLASSLVGATRAEAQRVPERPKLAASADTNDWEAYYDYAVKELRTRPKRAVAVAPWYAAPQYSLGVALRMAGERPAARSAFERYLAIAPRADSAYVTIVRGELARLADGATGK